MKHIFLILCLGLFVPHSLKASHRLGGEISYEALDTLGNFRFRIVAYRACDGIAWTGTPAPILRGPIIINTVLVAAYDITPNLGNCAQVSSCTPPATFNGAVGTIGKFIYEGTANLSSLGPPPSGEYTWVAEITCCRNPNQNSPSCSNSSMFLRVTMFPFITPSGDLLNPRQMRDSSPRFVDDPAALAINNPFDTLYFNNFAQDPDREDEVRFDLDMPLGPSGEPCSYGNGYTMASPMPGIIGSQVVDSLTGAMIYRPTTNGNFLLAIRVRSYRYGQPISEVFRDFQLSVYSNPVGSPPPYNPFMAKSAMDSQQRAPIISTSLLNSTTGFGNSTIYLIAGDTFSVAYTVKDSFPILPQPNLVRSFVRSDMLGNGGTSTSTGCAEPPCAIIQSSGNQSITMVSTQYRWSGYGIVADGGGQDINGRILWATAPQHARASGRNLPVRYWFHVVAFDDVCQFAGSSTKSLNVVVFPNLVSIPAPKGLCVEPLSAGANLIRWNPIIDSLTIDPAELLVTGLGHAQQLDRSIQRRRNSFIRAELIRTNASGGSVIVANLSSPDVTSFTDATAAFDSVYSYQIRIVSALDTQLLQLSNAVVAPRPAVVGDRATLMYTLSWQPPYSPTAQNPGFTGTYYIYQRNVSMQSAWQLVDSVVNLTSYSGPIQLSNDTLAFRIGWLATNSCAINISHTTLAVFDQSLSTPELDLQVRIYPNPVGEVLNVSGLNSGNYISWRILDVTGKMVLKGRVESVQIKTQSLVPGTYMLELVGKSTDLVRFRFVKE